MQRPQKSDFDCPRRARRFVPSKPLTVAVLEAGDPVAYGVVANISTGGICLQSVEFSMSRSFDLVLSFAGGDILEATGHVVWGKPIGDSNGHALYGLEFAELSDSGKASLDAALESPSFVPSDG